MTSINLDNKNLNRIETIENKNNINSNQQVATQQETTTSNIGNDNSLSTVNPKGNVPASGLSFGGKSDNSIQASITSISNLIQGYSKSEIQNILKNIENIDFSKGLDNISDNQVLALAQLNLDLNSKRGVVTITDADGNTINPDKLNELVSSIKTTLQRSISSNTVSNIATTDTQSNIKDEDFINALANTVKEHDKAMEYNEKVVEPLNKELQSNIEKFEALSSQAKQLSEKVDKGISEILSLKNQATSLIDNSVSRTLTETEKKQLKSIEQTISFKQQQLIKDSKLSESLMGDINSVFTSFEGSLNESEKSTMAGMKSALEKKVSGQALTVRENFLAGISEEIYKLTSGMSESEIKNVMENQEVRVKMLSGNNKLLDKMINSKSISNFSESELSEIAKKFKIRIVQEGNDIALYYTGNKDGKETRVNKNELREMKTDLNNIVTSPELFTLSRAVGEISIAYTNENNINIITSNSSNDPKIVNEEKSNSAYKNIENNINNKDNSKKNNDLTVKENITDIKTPLKGSDISYLQKNLERKQEEEKYHLKEIDKIHERRRVINKDLENKRLQEKYGI